MLELDTLIRVLKEALIESSRYIQNQSYLTNEQMTGDLYTRLNRMLKLYNLGGILDRKVISSMTGYPRQGIQSILLVNYKYESPLQKHLTYTLVEAHKSIDIGLINLEAKLAITITEVESYKI